jgi:hypothetical protein
LQQLVEPERLARAGRRAGGVGGANLVQGAGRDHCVDARLDAVV